MTKKNPEVTCYLCKRTFQKVVHGAAHTRNYYRCEDCLNPDWASTPFTRQFKKDCEELTRRIDNRT
jgi:hypothetical protein